MVRKLWLIPFALLTALMIGCGGGANDDPPKTLIRLTAEFTGDGVSQTFVEVEMVKDITNVVGRARVGAEFVRPTTGPTNDTTRNLTVTGYTVSYRRLDGGTIVPESFDGSVERFLTVDDVTTFDVLIFPVKEKLTSAFAREFLNNILLGQAGPIDLEVSLTVRARSGTGDALSATDSIRIQAAVYNPVDELLPTIDSFSQSTDLVLGQDYLASWFVDIGRFPIVGEFITPWGDSLSLGASFFPNGVLDLPTDGFTPNNQLGNPEIQPGTTATFQSGVLVVSNVFGSVRSQSSDQVRITNPPPPDPEPEPEPDPVTIDQFFADRSTINQGEEVEITVLTSGNVTRVELSPNIYDGVTVSLPNTPAELKFFTFRIRPQFSVRPFLVAYDDENNLRDASFLSTAITVVPPDENPPEVLFYRASNTTVPIGGRVVLFWRVAGQIEKLELLPINNSVIDVTGRDSYTTPPFNQEGVQNITLIVTPSNGGTPIFQTLSLNVTDNPNQPVEILNLNQQPGTQVGNDDQGVFSFTISDPEGADSSWRVAKVAGDNVSFFPLSGKIPDGLGDDSVAFDDKVDNANGFFTFELSAWDDSNFGFTVGSNRTVRLVTYTTPDRLTDNAPVISNETFTSANDENSEGTISFDYADPDTLNLNWSVRIAAGDFGGSFDRAGGTNNTGGGSEAIRYTDDPDTPDANVVFLIRVVEGININPQADVALIQVNKGTGDVSTTPDPTENPISFEFTGLFDNNFGGVNSFDEIGNFTLFFNGDLAGTPQFYKNSDLSDEVNAASLVVDIKHSTDDPQSTINVRYTRDFITPNTIANLGDLFFVNYFPNGGSSVGGSATPIDAGVARWNMLFSVESFRNGDTNMLNLPASSGVTRSYLVVIEAEDNQGETNSVSQIIRVTVP